MGRPVEPGVQVGQHGLDRAREVGVGAGHQVRRHQLLAVIRDDDAKAKPAGQIRHQDIGAEMQFRLVDDPPAAGTIATPIEAVTQTSAQYRISSGMFWSRQRMGMQLAGKDLTHQMFRQIQKV